MCTVDKLCSVLAYSFSLVLYLGRFIYDYYYIIITMAQFPDKCCHSSGSIGHHRLCHKNGWKMAVCRHTIHHSRVTTSQLLSTLCESDPPRAFTPLTLKVVPCSVFSVHLLYLTLCISVFNSVIVLTVLFVCSICCCSIDVYPKFESL